MKENELQYVKKEVQCLREELQMMQKVSVSGSHWEGSRREEGGERQGFMSAGFMFLASCSAGFHGMLRPNFVICAPYPCLLLSL